MAVCNFGSMIYEDQLPASIECKSEVSYGIIAIVKARKQNGVPIHEPNRDFTVFDLKRLCVWLGILISHQNLNFQVCPLQCRLRKF